MWRNLFVIALLASTIYANVDQIVFGDEPKQPRGSNEDLMNAVTREFSRYYPSNVSPFLPDANFDSGASRVWLRLPIFCRAYVTEPSHVAGNPGIQCDKNSPLPCVRSLKYIQSQTYSTSRSVTNNIGISAGAAFKAFSFGIEYSSSVTNTVTHEWSNGREIEDQFSVPPGRSCYLKISTYAYKCDYSEWTAPFLRQFRPRREVTSWYNELEPLGRGAMIPYSDAVAYVLVRTNGYTDVYLCYPGMNDCLDFPSESTSFSGNKYDQSNPTTLENGAMPGYVSCVIS